MDARTPRVLITGVGSNIGQGIVKALRLEFPAARVVGTDANPTAGGFYACDAAFLLPRANDPEYGAALERVMLAESIELVLSGSHFEPPVLARLRPALEAATGAAVLVSPPDVVDTCVDKWRTVERLRAARGCRWPRTLLGENASAAELDDFARDVGLPLVVKPRDGQGSRDLHIVKSLAALAATVAATPRALVQEHLGSDDEEYTVAILSDEIGRVQALTAMRRVLAAGTTVLAETGHFAEIEAEAARIAAALGLRGPSNVQLRRTERGPVAFEVNPRFSGTTALRALAGWNDVAAAVRHFLYHEPIAMDPPRPGRITRHWDEVFVPMEEADAVLRDGSWRPSPDSGVRHLALYPPPSRRA
jgi:carbamoyl-phosphate synthase large subunit